MQFNHLFVPHFRYISQHLTMSTLILGHPIFTHCLPLGFRPGTNTSTASELAVPAQFAFALAQVNAVTNANSPLFAAGGRETVVALPSQVSPLQYAFKPEEIVESRQVSPHSSCWMPTLYRRISSPTPCRPTCSRAIFHIPIRIHVYSEPHAYSTLPSLLPSLPPHQLVVVGRSVSTTAGGRRAARWRP